MSSTSILMFLGIAVFFGTCFFALGFFVRKKIGEKRIRSAELRAQEIEVAAEREAERRKLELDREADNYLLKLKQQFDDRQNERKKELDAMMSGLIDREAEADKENDRLLKLESEIKRREVKADERMTEADELKKKMQRLIREQNEKLCDISGMGLKEAKRQLLRELESEVRVEASRTIRAVEEEAHQIADTKAQKILSLAIQRQAAEHVSTAAVSILQLPSDEMKGRIIGKDGRNVRTFEQATGVDVLIDDTPGAVVLSAFDPIRREVAKLSLEQLIEDGRIHPSTIEETVARVRKQLDDSIMREGENAFTELGLEAGDKEIIRLLGSLKFRTSCGQNSLDHAKEVAFIMNIMAGELGLDVKKAKRAGLLHDIGKAVDHETEGPHALIGGDLARRHGEDKDVVHAIEAHHGDVDPASVLPVLLQAADAVSGARPGARRETLEHFIQRMDSLERVAKAIPGVENVFAIQAGREVRVMVDPVEVADDEMPALAREITKKVEGNLNFPGQIRVTVIRETRATEFAKSLES